MLLAWPVIAALVAGAPEPKRPVLVTVDDLPIAADSLHSASEERARITRGLLSVLAKHHVKAVGLVTWSRLHGPADRALLESWLAAGHELGNHSTKHLDYTTTPFPEYRADVEAARVALAELLARHHTSLRYFRFPFLDEGETPEKLALMRHYLEESGQRSLPVTIDDQDWSFEKPYVDALRAKDEKARRLLSADYLAMMRSDVELHERRGDGLFGRKVPQILLLHAGEVGAFEWDALFSWLEETGHTFASSDEVLADPAFSEPHAFVGDNGPGLWDRIRDDRRRKAATAALATLFAEQAAAWSRGDLDAFTAPYADDATFVSPSGITRGRQAIVERYAKKYATKEAMGTLTLEVLETRLMKGLEFSRWGDAEPSRTHGASAVLRWTLSYPDKPPATGLSLVTLTPRPGRAGEWVINEDASF